MIDDMTALKQAMGEMDAEDPAVAEAAKDRAARILGDARLSFSKMAELIEQRRLLLRPKIVANIKRMDQPDMLGDAAFRDAGSALRREGQTFRQIAEAIELNGGPPSRYVDPVHTSEALQTNLSLSEPAEPVWLYALALAAENHLFPGTTSPAVLHRRAPRLRAVQHRAWLCRFRAASFGICRCRCRRSPARGQGDERCRRQAELAATSGGCGIADAGADPIGRPHHRVGSSSHHHCHAGYSHD